MDIPANFVDIVNEILSWYPVEGIDVGLDEGCEDGRDDGCLEGCLEGCLDG